MKEKIFVSGASGCLGANLARKLSKEGHTVHAFVYPNTNHPYIKDNKRIKLFEGNVLDKESIEKAMKECSLVYHVAGLVSYFKKDYNKMMKVHVEGTKNVLDVAKKLKVKKIVCTTSTAAIGLSNKASEILNENTEWNKKYDKIGYMYSKKKSEDLIEKYSKEGLNVVIVEPTSFFGAGDINMNEGEIIKSIKTGKVKFATPGGNSVVSVNDTVAGHILAMKMGKSGEKYILSNEFLTFKELFNIIAKEVKVKEIKKVMPKWTFFFAYPFSFILEIMSDIFKLKIKLTPPVVNFSYKFRYYSSQKAKKELGWKQKQSIKDAMKEAVIFYEENNLI